MQPRRQCNNFYTKSFFHQNSWSCPQAYRGAGCHCKLPLDAATDFLSTIREDNTMVLSKSKFCLSFILVLPRKPKNASKCVWIGPKHHLGNLKYFFTKSWSSSHNIYAGKIFNGNPISTKSSKLDGMGPVENRSSTNKKGGSPALLV